MRFTTDDMLVHLPSSSSYSLSHFLVIIECWLCFNFQSCIKNILMSNYFYIQIVLMLVKNKNLSKVSGCNRNWITSCAIILFQIFPYPVRGSNWMMLLWKFHETIVDSYFRNNVRTNNFYFCILMSHKELRRILLF